MSFGCGPILHPPADEGADCQNQAMVTSGLRSPRTAHETAGFPKR